MPHDPLITLAAHVSRHAVAQPDACAVRLRESAISYQSLDRLARSVAAGLQRIGIGAGDILAVQLPNSLEFIVTLLAASRIGAITQTVHMPYRRVELSSLLEHSKACAFIGLTQFKDYSPIRTVLDLKVQATSGSSTLHHIISVGESIAGSHSWAVLAEAEPGIDLCADDIDSPYVLLYTSGTTTSPKGILTSARRFVGNAGQAVGELKYCASDVVLSAAPFTHLYGLFVLQCALVAGASVSLLPAFSPAELIDTVRRDQPTVIFAGPAHFKPLINQNLMQPHEFACTRLVCLSGTTVPPALARAVEARLPAGVVIQLWGMSELQAGSYGRPDDSASIRHETAGRAAPDMQLQVVGDDNRPLPRGEEGRLQIRGPSVFDGYLNNAAESQACLSNGWFDTGDTAVLRNDGGLVITGRVKELINRGGIKFNPVDVEALLDSVPGVGRCILAPMPDQVLGERTCAFVQPDGRADVTLEALVQALNSAGVAKFKWPERLEFVDEFPVTPTQKVRRALLTASLVAKRTTGVS